MELQELKLVRLISVLLLLFLMGCGNKPAQENTDSCIVKLFANEVALNSNDNVVMLTETIGWTDSSSHIRVLSLPKDRIQGEDIYHTNWNDVDLYYDMIIPESKESQYMKKSYKECSFGRLKWKKVPLKNPIMDEMVPLEDFYEIQFIYVFNSRCIFSTSMSGTVQLKSKITSQCRICDD